MKDAKNTKNTKNKHTHTNPVQSNLTLVARWTTPIESTQKRRAVEFRGERSVREMNQGVGERVGSTRISHIQIHTSNKGSLDTKGI
jgi:hypothetical protein